MRPPELVPALAMAVPQLPTDLPGWLMGGVAVLVGLTYVGRYVGVPIVLAILKRRNGAPEPEESTLAVVKEVRRLARDTWEMHDRYLDPGMSKLQEHTGEPEPRWHNGTVILLLEEMLAASTATQEAVERHTQAVLASVSSTERRVGALDAAVAVERERIDRLAGLSEAG